MNNIADIKWTRPDLLDILWRLQNQRGMVADLAQILQRLEDMLLGNCILFAILHSGLGGCHRLRVSIGIVKLLLKVREVTLVVLDNLRWEITQDIFLETSKQERKHLFVQGFERQGG